MSHPFAELAKIDVRPWLEKKGNLSYLSWPHAVHQLLTRDPDAFWEYSEPVKYGNTMMVVCTVTAFGKPRTMHLPVMDNRNRPIADPDAFQVNTAMMRCLVKSIALHGLGLAVYAGEDVLGTDEPEPPELDADVVLQFEAAESLDALAGIWASLPASERKAYAGVKDAAKRRLQEPAHA